MILHFGLSSYLLLLLRFLLLLLLSDAGTLTTMDTGHSPSILMVTSQDYVLFTGDFAVNYTLGDSVSSDDLQVQLINHVDDSQMAVLSLPSNSSEGQLVVACGTINTTGSIFFALSSKDSDLVVAVSEIVHVSWPPVVIRTSTGSHSFPALTENIAVEVIVNDWDRLTCPGNDSGTEYSVTLDYYGSSDWRSSPESPNPRSMHRINITRFFLRREHSVNFHCRIVDQPGDYLVVLRSPKSSTIAVSDYLEVYWNPGSYELRSTLAAVFPCFDDVTVSFTRPRCAANDDKIRLYRQLRHENVTLASSSTLSYVAERRTTKLSNHVTFGCGEFEEEEPAPSYCWKYVSTARSGATYEHSTFCLPATTKDRPTNGQWSTWSEWSACSATCLSGTQVRFRSCDNPPPANGGTFCDGPMTESRQCDVICPELSPPTTSLSHLPSTNSSCDCGCRMTEPEGAVVAVPGCPSVVQWVIAVNPGLTIRLTFLVFDLESDGQAGVRVRDGESAMSNLLLNSFGGGGGAGFPPDVVSTGSVLTIEFRAPANSSGGFVAKYYAQAANTSLAGGVPQTESSAWETPVWKSTAIIVGVSLCVVVVTIAVVIVCCDVGANCAKRRRKKRLNTKGHTVAFDTVPPKTIELDYEEVPSHVRVEVSSAAGVGLEVVRVYPSTGSDDITTSKFLATSSPYLGAEGRDPGRRSSGRKRSRTRGGASEKNLKEGGLVRHPVDSQPLRHSSKTGKHRRHSRNDGDDVARNKRRPKSRDRKPPLPSSTFEEDLLMLARQTEVTEGGGAAVALDTGLGPLGSGASPEQPRLKGSFSRSRPTPKCDTPEKIPLQSKEIKVRSRRNRAHNSSAQPRAAAQGGEMTERGHGVIVGQRPPVEGSYDTVPDSSCRTSTDATVEHREIVQGQKVKEESTVNVSTLKDGSTSMGGSGVAMTLIADSGDPRVTESDKSRWMLDRAPNNDPVVEKASGNGSGKKASSFRTVNGSATADRVQDQGLHIQSFLRPHPGPDGQSQRGTFHSNSNSLACSNSPSFRMSTERTSTHSTFRPVPVPARSERLSQSPDATPRQAKSSSPHLHGIAPHASTGSEEICTSSVPIGSFSPSPRDTLVPSLPNHELEEDPGLLKTDLHSNGTIPGPL